jgi:hypothetical protein
MNPLAIAVQGLGFGFAMLAVQGLLTYVAANIILNGPDDEADPSIFIQRQNAALLNVVAAFVASGALDG